VKNGQESLKQIITHIVECYREKLESITYVQTFADLINKYDQLHDPARSSQYQESIAQQR
jgi:protein phosphatase-4 regulatory subunit 3